MMDKPFSQAVLWPSTTCSPEQEEAFVAFIADEFDGTRAKFIGCFLTKPDIDKFGEPVPETGGRSDLLFAVHEDDIPKFAVQRLQYGMRWVDDVIENELRRGDATIYVREVHELRSWKRDAE